MQKYESEITIVGGGPVGLAAACALADCGLKVLLVDAGKRTGKDNEQKVYAEKPKFDPRVSALTVSSRNLLERFG
ncbi:MAG: FAD-dependent oxidoreductase, partial [Gammaproteobacteria bacterium]